jgi:hypothetical protein
MIASRSGSGAGRLSADLRTLDRLVDALRVAVEADCGDRDHHQVGDAEKGAGQGHGEVERQAPDAHAVMQIGLAQPLPAAEPQMERVAEDARVTLTDCDASISGASILVPAS